MSTTAELVVAALALRGATVATCESLTGGLVGAAITSVPGASTVYRGGLITYATDLKAALAGVDPALLEHRGPVDGDVARQMAEGVRRRCGADWGVSTTGVAGPEPLGGASAGTVWIGIAGPDAGDGRSVLLSLDGDRAAIREASVDAALDLLLAGVRRE